MKYIIVMLSLGILFSCNTEVVEKSKPKKETKKIVNDSINILDKSHTSIEKKSFDNGIVIEWYKKGDGEAVGNGDVIQIDYKVKLVNGDEVDGNHLRRAASLPFLIGFGMQTPGWDFALSKMKVGDFAKILIPSKLARGEVGIKGLIPPNSDNYLIIRILEKVKPTRIIEGCKVWLLLENPTNKVLFDENKSITIHSMVSSESNPFYINTYRENKPFTFNYSDYGIIPGLKKALLKSKKADKMYIVVPPEQAYGKDGYLDIVKPNESIFYDVFVMDVK
jgi:FKBP-type peptidyl-prolyl cis-trans isomerase